MALSFSTALKNFILERGSLKQALLDGVIRIYSGTRPLTADSAISGSTLLVSISLNGGAYTENNPSTAKVSFIKISGTPSTGTIRVNINGIVVDLNEVNSNDLTWHITQLAYKLNVNCKDIIATPVISPISDTGIAVMAKFAGEDFTISATQLSTGLSVTLENLIANNRTTGLHLGSASNGVISKESQVWKGTAVASGTASWFRIQGSAEDDDTARTDLIRIDGSIGTSGADMILSSTSITVGTEITVDSCSFALP